MALPGLRTTLHGRPIGSHRSLTRSRRSGCSTTRTACCTILTVKGGADADKALKVGRDAGVFPASGRPYVVDHVEVKVAAAMRDSGEMAGVLVINNSSGPCLLDDEGNVAPMSCLAYQPRLLLAEATLTVWWPAPGGGPPRNQTFVGGQS